MLLSFFLSFFLLESIFSQQIIECGTIDHFEEIVDSTDNFYYDRFSNRYSDTYFKSLDLNILTCDQNPLEYFELNYSDDVTIEMRPVICEVFSYIESILPQRNESTSCGDPIENRKVIIDVFADITDSNIGGTGTPLYSAPLDWNCLELVLGRPYIKINGGYPEPDNNEPDGILRLNPSLNWNYNTSLNPVPAGETDLYAVVLHEALHILAYASRVNITETPQEPEAYTLWDQQLYYTNQYEPDGSSIMQNSVIQSDPNANCWSHTTTHSNFLTNVFGSCSASFTPDIVLGNTGIAPIAGGPITTDQDLLRNMLSHLKNDCNGQNGIAYVMHPGIDITMPYTAVREITQPELEILCELGYQISTNNYSCDGCYVIAHIENFLYPTEEGGCCEHLFHSCLDDVLIINKSDLICNDISGNDDEMEVINLVQYSIGGVPVTINDNGSFFEITSLTPGIKYFYYTLRGCDSKMHNERVAIVFDQCLECDDDYCENLLCIDDFEDLFPTGHQNLGFPFIYDGSNNNTPDINQFNGNNYLFLGEFSSSNKEAAALELKEPVPLDCTIILSFDAVDTEPINTEIGILYVWGSATPPCTPSEAFVNYGCGVSTDCGGNSLYEPVCIGTINIPNSTLPANLNLQTYNLQWYNDQGSINYIILTAAEENLALDNFNLTRVCIDPDFEYEIDCETLTVGFTAFDQNTLYTHHWDFGDGTTSTEVNPIHQYPTADIYTVTHTVTDECGNSAQTIQEVDLTDCEIGSELCNCPTGISYDAGEGTTASDLGIPLTLTDQCISISGRLILDDVYTWSNVEARMLPGAEIVIKGFGDRLNIYDHSVLFGCETMWRGIVLGPNKAKLDMQDSEIRDAQFAITASAGCRINLLNNIFNANNVGIYTAPSTTSQFFKPDNNIPWENNIFQSTYPLLAAYSLEQFPAPGTTALSGMWFNDVHSLINLFDNGLTNYIEGSKFGVIIDRGVNLEFTSLEITNLVSINNFTGIGFLVEDSEIIEIVETQIGNIPLDLDTESIRIGVLGTNTELEFHENLLATNTIGIELINGLNKSVNIYDNPLINSVSGIQVVNYNNDSEEIEIEDNVAMQVLYGVTLISVNSEVLVEDNIINVDADTWPQNDGRGIDISSSQGEISILENTINFSSNILQPGGRGIGVFNSQNCLVVDNFINGPSSGSPMMNFGIRVGSAVNNAYCCNTVDGSLVGVEFAGICNETSLHNSNFNNHVFGLRLRNAIIGFQENTGNSWGGANTIKDARFDGVPTIIPFSLFRTDPNLIPDGYNKISVPQGAQPSDWFTFDGTDPSCSNDCDVENPWLLGSTDGLNSGDIHTATDLITSDPIIKGLNWEARQNLFAKLNQHPNLLAQDNSIATFYNSVSNTSLAEFYTLKQGVTSVYQTGISTSSYWSLKESIDDISSQIDSLWILWETASTSEKLVIESQIDGLIESQGNTFDDLKTLEGQLIADRILAIDALIQDNNAIVSTEIYELNEQNITDLYLNTLAKGIYAFTIDQKTLINDVAEQCPFIGGTSVYTARALQSLYYPQEYDDEVICAETEKRSEDLGKIIEKTITADIYPNPAKDDLNIQFSQSLKNDSYLNIFDLTGKQVLRGNLPAGIGLYKIKTGVMSAGIYFYKVEDGNKRTISSGKFVISK